MADYGNVYTKGSGFRALAERQQRQYRADVLHANDDGEWGHHLCTSAAEAGRNFLTPAIYQAVLERDRQGKGIDLPRTRGNMLSSQAMCFNLFSPLSSRYGRNIMARVLAHFIGNMGGIRHIGFEYTPCNGLFGDQTKVGGVDCDLLVEFDNGVLGVETKFVEKEFSRCGFCKSRCATRCPTKATLDPAKCLYTEKKRYRYWERSGELRTLVRDAIEGHPCPFDGPKWQLWVNHTLVQAKAKANRCGGKGIFAVCAPSANKAIMRDSILRDFQSLLTDPSTFVFIPLERLIGELKAELGTEPEWSEWVNGLEMRYVVGLPEVRQ